MIHASMNYNLDSQKCFQQKKWKIQGKCTGKKKKKREYQIRRVLSNNQKKEEFRFSDP